MFCPSDGGHLKKKKKEAFRKKCESRRMSSLTCARGDARLHAVILGMRRSRVAGHCMRKVSEAPLRASHVKFEQCSESETSWKRKFYPSDRIREIYIYIAKGTGFTVRSLLQKSPFSWPYFYLAFS